MARINDKFSSTLLVTLVMLAAVAAVSAQTSQTSAVPADLQLSPAQVAAIKSIRAQTEKKAAPLALRLAGLVKQIYDNMLSDTENVRLRRQLSQRMQRVAAQLLVVKGESIRQTVRILTPKQRGLIKEQMTKPGAPADLSELIPRVFQIPEN